MFFPKRDHPGPVKGQQIIGYFCPSPESVKSVFLGSLFTLRMLATRFSACRKPDFIMLRVGYSVQNVPSVKSLPLSVGPGSTATLILYFRGMGKNSPIGIICSSP